MKTPGGFTTLLPTTRGTAFNSPARGHRIGVLNRERESAMSTSINNGPKITGFTPIAFVGTVATVYDTDNEGNPLVVGSGRNKGKPYVRALLRSSEVRGQSLIITFWDPTDCPEEGDFGVFRLRVGNSGRLEFASFQKDEENEYLERESEVLG